MKITISNKIRVDEIPDKLSREIKTRLTVKNPAFLDAQKMGRSTWNLEENLFLYEQPVPESLIVPRGFVQQLCGLCKNHNISFTWKDETRELTPVDFQFRGELRDYQEQAANAVLHRRFGVVQAPTGSGKTVMALFIIAERKQPTLIVVHTKELLNQWVDRIHSFLEIPVEEIGIIGSGKKRIGARITVGMIQTLYKCKEDVSNFIGHMIVDECHRCPSRTFTEAVSAFDSRYMLGLSATPYRRDGLTKLIYWHIGDKVHSIGQAELTKNGAILPFKVRWVQTNFTTHLDPSNEYSKMLSELTQNPARNSLVSQEVARQAKTGHGIPLVFTDRKAHCQAISEGLERDHGVNADVLTGNLSRKARASVLEKLNSGQSEALIATSALIGEGFDLPSLGSVILSTPIKFKGRLIQAIGRALRPSPGQSEAMIIDFVDVNIGVLEHSAKQRLKAYRQLGASGC